jgi:hypothetical protein
VNKPSRGYYELAKDSENKLYGWRVKKGEFDRDEAYRETIKEERKRYQEQLREKERSASTAGITKGSKGLARII